MTDVSFKINIIQLHEHCSLYKLEIIFYCECNASSCIINSMLSQMLLRTRNYFIQNSHFQSDKFPWSCKITKNGLTKGRIWVDRNVVECKDRRILWNYWMKTIIDNSVHERGIIFDVFWNNDNIDNVEVLIRPINSGSLYQYSSHITCL